MKPKLIAMENTQVNEMNCNSLEHISFKSSKNPRTVVRSFPTRPQSQMLWKYLSGIDVLEYYRTLENP